MQSKSEISKAFVEQFVLTVQYYRSLTMEQFYKDCQPKWSAVEQIVHLIKSTKPVTSGLQTPKLVFLAFGVNKGESRSYENVVTQYKGIIDNGGKSTAKYEPGEKRGNGEEAKTKLLESWEKLGMELAKGLTKWDEKDLDKYRAPHPLLGKLTIRELLFFTHFHIQYHTESIKSLVD